MKISEIITDKYKLRIPPTVYYDLLADVLEVEENQLPTTKNDLGVECISRDSAIKALDYDIESFEFKSGVSKHMDDIAKLLNTIYEIQVNNIKALTSVTPQEPRKGHWIPTYGNVECSVCGHTEEARCVGKATHYCSFCGAKMVEEHQGENK